MGVTIAIALLFLGLMVSWGVERGLETYRARLGADLLVAPREVKGNMESIFLLGKSEKQYFNGKIVDELRSLKGIKRISPQVFLESVAASCCSAGYVFIIGYDPKTDFTLLPWISLRERGKIGKDDAVVGANIIQPVGFFLRFYGHRFKIVAQLDRTGVGFYDNAVYLPIETVYKMAQESKVKPEIYDLNLKRGWISTAFIELEKGVNAQEIEGKIKRRYPNLETVKAIGLVKKVKEELPRLQRYFFIFISFVSVALFFLITIVFYLFNQMRRREHGLLRALGGRKMDLLTLVLLEGSLLILFGSFAGIILALTIKHLFYRWVIFTLKMPLLYPSLSLQLLGMMISTTLILVIGLVGAFYPAYLIANEEPYESIRFSG